MLEELKTNHRALVEEVCEQIGAGKIRRLLQNLLGEGVAVCGERLRQLAGGEIAFLGPPASDPRAAHVGRIAAPILARGEGGPVGDLVPRYLRRAEAEVVRTGVRFERR